MSPVRVCACSRLHRLLGTRWNNQPKILTEANTTQKMRTVRFVASILIARTPRAAAGSFGHKGVKAIATPAAVPPIITCPEGFLPEANKCVRQVVQPLIPTCIEGILQPDNSCLILIPPTRLCPPEFASVGLNCIRSATAPAALSCPHDFIFEPGYKKSASVCTRAIQGPPIGICPQGSIQRPDGCAREHSILPAMICPEGSILNGQVCINTARYDCAPSLPISKHNHKRMLAERADPHTVANPLSLEGDVDGFADARELGHGVKKIKHVATEIVNVAIVSQECERRTILPPIFQCPTGGVLLGRECIIVDLLPPIAGPPTINVETAPPTATCPPAFAPCGGFKVNKKHPHECCSSQEAPAAIGCIAGFMQVGDTCQAFRPAELVCAAAGFSKHKHRAECQRTQYVEPIITYTTQLTCAGNDCAGKQKHGHHHGDEFEGF